MDRVHRIWQGIKQRCNNPKTNTYPHYGALGIKICDEWANSSDAFVKWAMDNGYRDDLSIDRIDNSKGYFPENCRWATRKEQTLNRKPTYWLTIDSVTMCLKDWAKEKGVNYRTVYSRWHKGIRGDALFAEPNPLHRRKVDRHV